MKKYVMIDTRMREVEKEKLRSIGYELIELKRAHNVYEEISSHVDIFCTKIKDHVILEKSVYHEITSKIGGSNIYLGQAVLQEKYPLDIPFNVCNIGNFAIHNFHYTDQKVLAIIERLGIEKINISQGYSNCSIAVIDSRSAIVTDRKIYNTLKDYDFNILYLDYIPDIKLLHGNGYSSMHGLIGGAISMIGNHIIVFGDLNKIDKGGMIREFIGSIKKDIIDFKGLDVIDYGGILEV